MTMSLKEFERLKKFMRLTDSDNDNEALAALRQGRKVLTAHGYTWDSVFDRLVRLDVEAAEPENEPRSSSTRTASASYADDVDRDFAALASADFHSDFLDSIREQWEEKRWMSPRQRSALRDNVQRLRREGRIA